MSNVVCRRWQVYSAWTPILVLALAGLFRPAAAAEAVERTGADRVVPGAVADRDDAGRRAEAEEAVNLALEVIIEHALGLSASDVFLLDAELVPGQALTATVPLAGTSHALELFPYSIRSERYEVLVQRPDGSIFEMAPGPERTLRGGLVGLPGSRATGAVLEDGLRAMIDAGDGERYWIEPVARVIPGAIDRYVVYRDEDVLPHGGACGLPEGLVADPGDEFVIGKHGEVIPAGGGAAAGGICIAELACDADTEYFNAYGSVSAVEARINSVINTVNLQYEAQVGLTHQITTILVRTGSDPYTSTDAQTRLCQFITEWTNNQQSIPRDVAHLFTGAELDGGTIGIAADIGATGICQPQGACTGGQFGTQGSYCLSQSDFNGNFSCATDLTAHELGHLWGAFHCSCPGNTMNPSITCANNFGTGTINSISAYRDSRTCLDGTCSGGPEPPANDLCADATPIPCNTTEVLSNLNATPVSGVGDPDLPSGSPSCQWQGNPNSVHNTVWYSFVAGDTSVEIQTCSTTAIQDTILGLYGGSCGSLTELACGEDSCGSSTYMSSICYDGLVPGNTYLVMVGNPGGWSGSTPGQIVLDVTCPCPTVGPVAGACCLASGSCLDLQTPATCSAAGGTFQGTGSDCASTTCTTIDGACCLVGGGCAVTDQAACTAQGGAWQGGGTDCFGEPCTITDVINVATADFATDRGAISSGSFLDTFMQDGVYEALTEEQVGGNPNRARSRLSHTWTFNVTAGASYSFHVDAYHTTNSEGDHFLFSWSPDDAAYTPMLTVMKESDDDVLQSYNFPQDIAGTVYIRVEDTNNTRGNSGLDTVFVDEMYIVSSGDGGGTGDPGMHVASIVVSTQNEGQGDKRGRADVTVVDETGAPVADATVTGTFSGDFNEPVFGVTDASGVVTLLTSTTMKGGVSIQFCVDGITHASLTYDPSANVETCDVN